MDFEKDWLRPLARLRRASLAGGAEDPPRFLVRVDEFPDSAGFDDPRLGYEASSRFHEVMADAGVAHLLAVVPQWTHDPRDPDARGGRELDERDVELLGRMRAGRVTFAQQGTTHRTRYRSPHHHSEFSGLPDAELAELLARGREQLRKAGIQPRVLVPPYNRFDASQWPVLADHYDVVTGGPESVSLFG